MVSTDASASNPLRRDAKRNEGKRLKSDIQSELEARRGYWIEQGRRALLTVALERGAASTDDVHEHVTLPDDIGPCCLGCIPRKLAKTGVIKREGYVPTSRKEAKNRPVSLWIIKDRDAALRYLANIPPLATAKDPERPITADAPLKPGTSTLIEDLSVSHGTNQLSLFGEDPNKDAA